MSDETTHVAAVCHLANDATPAVRILDNCVTMDVDTGYGAGITLFFDDADHLNAWAREVAYLANLARYGEESLPRLTFPN